MLSHPLRAAAAGVLIGLTFTASVVVLAPWTAEAIWPVADYVHTLHTVFHYIARATEISQKYLQIHNQYRQIYYDYEAFLRDLQNLKKIDKYWARNVVGTMERMERILEHDRTTHANPRVGSLHREVYPGWQPPRDWWREQERAATMTMDVLRDTLEAKYQAHRTTVDHIRTLLELKQQVKAVEGHEEVLEVMAQISAFEAEVVTLAQVAADTTADAQTAYYSYRVNQEARAERALKDAIENARAEVASTDAGSGWGALPSWWR